MSTQTHEKKSYDPGRPGSIQLYGSYLEGVFLVQSFRHTNVTYRVDLREESCGCPHHQRCGAVCKHLRAAREESERIARHICRELPLRKLKGQKDRTDLRPEIHQAIRQVIWERTEGASFIALLEETFGEYALN